MQNQDITERIVLYVVGAFPGHPSSCLSHICVLYFPALTPSYVTRQSSVSMQRFFHVQ